MNYGGLAQLARAPALQAGGHRFESDILHSFKRLESFESKKVLEAVNRLGLQKSFEKAAILDLEF